MFCIFIPTILEAKGIFKDELVYKGNNQYLFKDIDVYITGVSKTNSALHTTKMFCTKNYDKALMLGIAGAYDNSGLQLGDICTVEYDYFADEGYLKADHSMVEFLPKQFEITENNRAAFTTLDCIGKDSSKVVISNTVSLCQEDKNIVDAYQKTTNAKIENMEGAAFGLVSCMFNVQPYQVRSISNYCGDDNFDNWALKDAFLSIRSNIDNIISEIIS